MDKYELKIKKNPLYIDLIFTFPILKNRANIIWISSIRLKYPKNITFFIHFQNKTTPVFLTNLSKILEENYLTHS